MNFRRLMGLFICICLLGTIFSPARAATSNEIRNEIDKLEAQEQALQEQIDALEQQRVDNLTEMQQMISQKQVLDQQIALLNQQILTVQEQLLVMKTLVADQQDACDRAAAEHAALNEKYKERIRTMEEEGQLSYWSVLFRSSSLADFLDRLTIVQEIAQADRDRLQELRQAAQKVEAEKRTLLAQQSQLQATADDLEENQQLLEQKRAEYEETRKSDPSLPKFKAKEFRVNADEHHFYIPEELKYTADVKFEQKGSSWLGAVIFLVVLIIAMVILLLAMPTILSFLDGWFGNIYNAFSYKDNVVT